MCRRGRKRSDTDFIVWFYKLVLANPSDGEKRLQHCVLSECFKWSAGVDKIILWSGYEN